MNKLILCILVPLVLACGATIPIESESPAEGKVYLLSAPVEAAETVPMIVTGKLYVRAAPNGEVVSYLLDGDKVTVYAVEVVGDISWCRITPLDNSPRYVGCGWLEAE